jgi:Bor protein
MAGRLNALPDESEYGPRHIKEEMTMRSVYMLAALALLSGCAQHRLVVPRPNPTGAPLTVNSKAFAFGTVQPRNVAKCDTNIIDEVRVHQNLGQSLVSVLTLGIYMPTTIEYVCGNVPNSEGSTDN